MGTVSAQIKLGAFRDGHPPASGELGSMTAMESESKDGIVFTENLHTFSSVLDLRVTYHTDSSANGVQVTVVL